MRKKIFLLWLGLLAAAGVARSQPAASPATDAELCRNTTNLDLAIKHCSAAIDARKANNELLAQWYVLRGMRLGEKGDYDRAIADHTTALKLDAKVRLANYYRGKAYSNKGEFELAIADFDAAARLRSDDPVVYHARGIELMVRGDYARAIADFDKALQLEPKAEGVHFSRGRAHFYASDFPRAAADLETALAARPNVYIALWLFLARARSGNADADDLLERETRRLRGGWPSPLIALYMGRTDAQSVMAATKSGDANQQRDMRCEGDYYVAQSHILKGEQPRARTLLQGVQRGCPKNLLEYEATVAELKRLQ